MDAAVAGEAGYNVGTAVGQGGAFGLFLIPSGSDMTSADQVTGTLAAVWYVADSGSMQLSGTIADGTKTGQGNCALFPSLGASGSFRAVVLKATSAANNDGTHGNYSSDDTVVFDFNPASDTFIRKVFNTNPTFTNSSVHKNTSDNYARYWLGPTFEDNVKRMFERGDGTDAAPANAVGAAAGDVLGIIMPMQGASAAKLGDFTFDAQPAKSGWVFGQDLSAMTQSFSAPNMPKLFRFVTLEEAENVQREIKISIANIKAPPDGIPGAEYGRFDVILRQFGDNDRDIQAVETYTGCNLNPNSENYIAKRIGDQRFNWNDNEKRYRLMGNYPNVSKYLRVEMHSDVDDGAVDTELLPFGFYGIPTYSSMILSGATLQADAPIVGGGSATVTAYHDQTANGTAGTFGGWGANNDAKQVLFAAAATNNFHKNLTASIEFPKHQLVESASIAWLTDPDDRYLGLDVLRRGTTNVIDHSLYDVLGTKIRGAAMKDVWDAATEETTSNYFSLDDVRPELNTGLGAVYVSGSRATGKSYTAGCVDSTNGSLSANTDPNKAGYQKVLDAGYDKFTLPLYGGFEGIDITEQEPLINNRILDDQDAAQTKTIRTSYEYYTLRRAIDTVSDAEVVDMNMLAMPGMRDSTITDHMINTCEARADALAIIDLPYAYTPRHEADSASDGVNSYTGEGSFPKNRVDNVVTELRNTRKINSSYACCYYPWVQVRDSRNGINLWMPPSVVALGAMSYSQATRALWFAPAGFSRGGLSAGNAGLPVLQVSQRLSKKERDNLYEENVNPIAQFPAEGIVIFGQKTMLQVPSALDRINVRRLLLFIKKRISKMASEVLFDPNIQVTWNRFLAMAKPFLQGIVGGFGLEDYRIKLDTTTTTADLIDRNIMYAQIYIKPTKAIEFIALDFVITSQGASFDD